MNYKIIYTRTLFPVELVNRWLALYPEIPVVNAYGPTEASDDVIQAVIDKPLGKDEITVPIGCPLPNLNVLILDKQGCVLPNGLTGEICTTVSGLSEGMFWDFQNDQIAGFLLEYYGIDSMIIPETVPSFSI